MSLVTNRSRPLPGVLLLLVALAPLACLAPTAHAQVALTLFVSGTGDPSPVPSCFEVIGQLAMLEAPGLSATATDVVSGVGATLTAQTFGSLSCPSLRAAIRHANTNGNSGTDIIVLQGGSTYTLSIPGANEDNALTGDLDIRSNVRITTSTTALGSVAIVQGGTGWDDRIFDVRAGVVQIENLSIQRGFVGATGGSGGGIRNVSTLTLTNCTVSSNVARGAGGGIDNSGTLTLTSSTISFNRSDGDGGGIHNSQNATLANSTISANTANSGGGIANLGTLEVTGTTVGRSNLAQGLDHLGGGILNLGRLTVAKSTISSNADVGIFNTASGILTLTNSTVSSNFGAGILNANPTAGTVVLNNATVALNTGSGVINAGGPVFLSNTILADECEGQVISHDHNLFQFPTSTCPILMGAHDRIGVNPLLGDLRFNGGQTQTHAPAAGSPAIDNGHPDPVGNFPACPSTDQLGNTRPLDGDRFDPDGSGPIPPAVCDIGAVEVRPPVINQFVSCCVRVATTLGVLDLTPTEATVRVGERFTYAFEWTVPQGGWRTLDTLELRLVDGDEVILWVRFAETAHPPGTLGTFSLVDAKNGRERHGFAPGSHHRLKSKAATVYLEGSAAHGPPGSTVGLTLELSLKHKAAGRTYTVEVLASDDAGAETGFVEAGTLTVLSDKR